MCVLYLFLNLNIHLKLLADLQLSLSEKGNKNTDDSSWTLQIFVQSNFGSLIENALPPEATYNSLAKLQITLHDLHNYSLLKLS